MTASVHPKLRYRLDRDDDRPADDRWLPPEVFLPHASRAKAPDGFATSPNLGRPTLESIGDTPSFLFLQSLNDPPRSRNLALPPRDPEYRLALEYIAAHGLMDRYFPGASPAAFPVPTTARATKVTQLLRMALKRLGVVDPPGARPLRRIKATLALTDDELAYAFGVDRRVMRRWLNAGPPAHVQARIVGVYALVEFLQGVVKPGLLPGVFRRPGRRYGNRTLLDLLAEGRQDELLQRYRRAFSWSTLS
jgi:hypothetical protein